MSKESTHAQKLAIAVEYKGAVLFGQIDPGHVEWNTRRLRIPLQVGKQRTILWFGPRLDCSLCQRFHLVGDHEVEIEVDGVPEPLTLGASAIRIIERKQPRLWFFIPQIALLALKPLRKAKGCGAGLFVQITGELKDYVVRFPIGCFHRVNNPRARIWRNRQPVHEHENRLTEIDVE